METTTVRQATRSDVPALARSLAAAFEDDPVVGFVWPDADKRRRRAERNFAAQLNALWKRRLVYTDDDFSSIAVWARPGEWEIPAAAVARVTVTAVHNRVKMSSLLAYLRTDALHPKDEHWYLEFLGTVPESQGKGLGGKVLGPVLEQADAEGMPVWTWSSNRRNLGFYHRQRFDVVDELPFAKGGPPIFPIRRDPR